MANFLILDRDAALYGEAILGHLPGSHVDAVSDLAAAQACCGEADVLVALSHAVPDELVAAMPRLRWVQAMTTGVDHLLALPSLAADVRITSARGIHGPQMSEMAFFHMIALSRELPRMIANQAAGRWERWPQPLLLGKTVVLVGIGTISEALAARCQAFGMRVLGVSDARQSAPGFDEVFSRSGLEAAASMADFLIVMVPYEAATHRLIGRAVIAAMKPTGFLINLARGKVVDEAALIEALAARRIGGAGLDVFEVEPLPADSPLWHMDNVIVTPHVGGMSDVYAQQATPLLLHNAAAYVAGRWGEMRNVVRG